MRSIPIHLLVESQEHVVTVELSSGETYRGKLVRAEDNMNVQLDNVIVTSREGVKSQLNTVFVRGSHIKMFMLPDIIRYAPVLQPELMNKVKDDVKAQRKRALQRNPKGRPPRKQMKTA